MKRTIKFVISLFFIGIFFISCTNPSTPPGDEEETKEFNVDELEDKLEDMDFDEIEKFCP